MYISGPTPLPILGALRETRFCKSGLPVLVFVNGEKYVFNVKQKSWHPYVRLPAFALEDQECLTTFQLSDLEVGEYFFP